MKKKIEKVEFINVSELDLHLYCEWDCDYEQDCENSGCDYVCRCKEIVDLELTDIPTIETIVDLITNSKNKITRYAIDRILTKFEVYDKEMFDVEIGGGYYGEEVGSIWLGNSRKIQEEIEKFLSLKNNSDKIEYLLTLEYGHLLKEVENRNWKVKTIPTDKIVLGAKEHVKQVEKEECEYYKDYSLPRGIVLSENHAFNRHAENYRLIDGYHRITAAIKNGLKKVSIIVGENK